MKRWMGRILIGLVAAGAYMGQISLTGQGDLDRKAGISLDLVKPAGAFWRRDHWRRAGRAIRRTARRAWSGARRVVRRTTNWTSRTARRAWSGARRVVRRTTNWTSRTARRAWSGARRVVRQTTKWTGNAARSAWRGTTKGFGKAWSWTKNAAGKAANWAKNAMRFGVNWLKKQFDNIWKAVKALDCGALVTAFSAFDPISWVLGKIHPLVRTCHTEVKKGFFCAIPDMVKDIGTMLWGIAKAAWKNKGRCLAAGLATFPAVGTGSFACGFYYWAKEKVGKMVRCIQSLKGHQVLNILLEEGLKLGCYFAGTLIFDAAAAALSGGSSLVASIAKWMAKLKSALSPNTWMRISHKVGQHVVNNIVGYTINTAKRFSACN